MGLIKYDESIFVPSYDWLMAEILQKLWMERPLPAKNVVNILASDENIELKLRIDMSDQGAKFKMESLFAS